MTGKITRMFVARKRKGWTQLRLADELGVTQPKISAWERGVADLPPKRRDQIAELLEVPALTLTDEA